MRDLRTDRDEGDAKRNRAIEDGPGTCGKPVETNEDTSTLSRAIHHRIRFEGRPAPSRARTQNVYLGGIGVPKLGCASPHGFPSTSAICALQTRLTTNGHLATYFAVCGQRCASQSPLSASGSNSGPRLFVIIAAPASGSYKHPAIICAVTRIRL